MTKAITLNEGAQKSFVSNQHRASAYIGGLGSGKTFAGIARGLKFSQQPMPRDPDGSLSTIHGPRGCIAAINYPVLQDVVLPQFLDIVEGTGLLKDDAAGGYVRSSKKARLVVDCGCVKPRSCKHGAEILFRSLDRPNWMRGLELSWFFIDEGRHLTMEAWDVLYGRLRQSGYEHAGWVCSTPNGYDWMWKKFHPSSNDQLEGSKWFGAPTTENAKHLPPEYIKSLFATYEGLYLRQEVYGEFVGVPEGAVFHAFDQTKAAIEVPYDPKLELHSAWDFGIGDLQVVIFCQPDWTTKELPDGTKEWVPVARLVGSLSASDRTSQDWARSVHDYCDKYFGGRRPTLNVGDPAGLQRNGVTGTSVITDLAQWGIIITPAPKRAPDHAIRILNNMMEGNRVLVDAVKAADVVASISSYRWPLDPSGNRRGTSPVHDWTSHACDALRYWATVLFSVYPRRDKPEPKAPPGPGTIGHVLNQMIAPVDDWLGPPQERVIEWYPTITPRSV